jgi:outer membrane lipoprotein SlyB
LQKKHIFLGDFMRNIVAVGIICLLFIGCQTRTGTGTLTGAGIGALAGSIIGGGKGAIIGGAVGAVSGGIVGSALDEQDRKIMENTSPRTVDRMDRSEPITVSDIIKLSQGGVSDETIIRYIYSTKTRYHLTQAQIRRLQQGGVSQRVINYMVDTGA